MALNKIMQDEQNISTQKAWVYEWKRLHVRAVSQENHVNKVLMWECWHCVKGNMKIPNFSEIRIYQSKE